LKDLIAKLSESLSDGELLTSAAFACLFLIVNFKKIVEFLEDRKKARVANLVEALKCDQITGLTKSHLEEELAAEHFKLSTGIRLDKEFREELIKAYREANGEVRFDHYKRALPHLKFRDNTLSVRITWFERTGFFINGFCGLVLAIISLPLMFLSYFGKEVTFIQFLGQFGIGALYMIIAFFFFYQILSVISARHINGELQKRESKADEEGKIPQCEGLAS